MSIHQVLATSKQMQWLQCPIYNGTLKPLLGSVQTQEAFFFLFSDLRTYFSLDTILKISTILYVYTCLIPGLKILTILYVYTCLIHGLKKTIKSIHLCISFFFFFFFSFFSSFFFFFNKKCEVKNWNICIYIFRHSVRRGILFQGVEFT